MEEESSLRLAGHRTSTISALASGEMQGGAVGALLEITRKGNDDAGRGMLEKKKLKRYLCNGWQRWVIFTNSTKQELVEDPLEMLQGIGGVGS